MRKYLIFALFICGCIYNERQEHANKVVEDYTRSMLDHPHYLESVSFSEIQKKRYNTALDSSLNYAGVKGDDYQKISKFVDSQNNQRPDIADRNVVDLDNIKRGRLDYYTLIYTFRIDSAGQKKLKRYRFDLDSGYNVLKAQDITFTRTKIDYQ